MISNKQTHIHLIDVDSKIPNIALMRLSTYHKQQGNVVTLSKGANAPIPCDPEPDVCYASIIFRKNAHALDNFHWNFPDTQLIIGGVGYSLESRLPQEVEACPPDYSLYHDCDSSYGFSSRGCVRRCGFCVVPKAAAEGTWHKDQHPEIWYSPKFQKITFLDNNILADPEYFMGITDWCLERGLTIRFLSGYDIRLLTPAAAVRLHEIRKHHTLSFAWDDIRDERIILEKLDLLRSIFSDSDLRAYVQFYVYVDSDKEYDSAVYRCRTLKSLNCNAFVMINKENHITQRMRDLQRWAARKWIFWSIDIKDYGKNAAIIAKKRKAAKEKIEQGNLDDWI